MKLIEKRERLRELNILIKIGQNIISTLDYQKVLQIISDGMSELLNIESAAIYLIENKVTLRLVATTPPLDPQMPDFLRIASINDHPNIQSTITSRQAQIVGDTRKAELSQAERNIVEIRNLRSLLFFPFVQQENVLGVLILGTCNATRKYSSHEIHLGQSVANQLAVAIQNSLLHFELNRHKDNLELLVKEKTNDLDAAIEELKVINDELSGKNELINTQNIELKATIQNLKDTQLQLIQAEKMASLGVLTAGVAHEINNPLNFIFGAYNQLKKRFETGYNQDNEKNAILLQCISEGVTRITNIINGLNQFSRGNPEMNEDCNVQEILDNCVFMLNSQVKNNVSITKNYTQDRLFVSGNIGQLHQAFLNILTNAVQSIEGTGKIIILVKPDIEQNNLVIEIKDTGKGISKNNIAKVIEPFFTTQDPGKGTGLGLYIAYNIIRDHNGSLHFDSEENRGTRVRVLLPIKNALGKK
jgi:C4-dicarboxylate-specific signal transduction histidine kinase